MQIDISGLTAQELDDLIAQATERRAQTQPPVTSEAPKGGFLVVSNPAWYVTGSRGFTLLQFRHPGHGWVAFAIPRAERAHLLSLLLQTALLDPITDTAAPGSEVPTAAAPTPITGGGGTVH